jgi:hypothetical protein
VAVFGGVDVGLDLELHEGIDGRLHDHVGVVGAGMGPSTGSRLGSGLRLLDVERGVAIPLTDAGRQLQFGRPMVGQSLISAVWRSVTSLSRMRL